MRLAFLILAHKDPDQVARLADYLLSRGAGVFVHVDRKSRRAFNSFMKSAAGKEGLHVFSKFRVYWGSFNQIQATFYLLEKAVKSGKFDFVSLISGQDLPVKPLEEFSKYLAGHRKNSFFQFHALPAPELWADNGGLNRVNRFWLTGFPSPFSVFVNKVLVVLHRLQEAVSWSKKFALPLYGGANWFTLNREMAEYVLAYLHAHRSFYRKFRYTRCADEIILQTVLVNSRYRDDIINDALRFIDWQSGPEYPRTLRAADKERLVQSESFFARKFDRQVDSAIIDDIYKRL